MFSVKICIIGYKNHAIRLQKILHELGYQDTFLYNHNIHTKKSLVDFDVFFIASPNDTHVSWIEFLSRFDKYIFCEKPPAIGVEEFAKISRYDPKLYFNFNYRFTELSKITKEYLLNNKLGSILYMNCVSSTGIAFQKNYENDWRFVGDNLFSSVVGNVGIHYIDMIGYILEGIDCVDIKCSHITEKKLPDTSKISIQKDNIFADILVSYAAPFKNETTVVFENGCLYLNDGILSLAYPRDTFDNSGRYITPTSEVIFDGKNAKQYFDESLMKSISFFMKHAKNNIDISSKYYEQSINTTNLILKEFGGF